MLYAADAEKRVDGLNAEGRMIRQYGLGSLDLGRILSECIDNDVRINEDRHGCSVPPD